MREAAATVEGRWEAVAGQAVQLPQNRDWMVRLLDRDWRTLPVVLPVV